MRENARETKCLQISQMTSHSQTFILRTFTVSAYLIVHNIESSTLSYSGPAVCVLSENQARETIEHFCEPVGGDCSTAVAAIAVLAVHKEVAKEMENAAKTGQKRRVYATISEELKAKVAKYTAINQSMLPCFFNIVTINTNTLAICII